MVTYGNKNYCLINAPSSTDEVVLQATKHIEGQIKLQYVGKDLSNLGRFVWIAYFGVVGHPDLQIEVRKSIRNVLDLCHETDQTLTDFTRSSQEALEILQSTYQYLSENLEEHALKTLINLQEVSKNMKIKAGNLSKRCRNEAKVIQKVGDATIKERAKVVKKNLSNEKEIEYLKKQEELRNSSIKQAESENLQAKSYLQSVNSKEEEVLKELRKKQEENQRKTQEKNREMQEKREQYISEYDQKISKAKEDYNSLIMKNEEKYLEQMNTNKTEFEASLLAANKEYEEAIIQIKEEYNKNLELNTKWLQEEKANIKKECSESIRDKCKPQNDKITEIENDYKSEIKRIEMELQNNLDANKTKLDNALKEIQEKLDLKLLGNEKECTSKKKETRFYQMGSRAQFDTLKVEKDQNAKTQKASEESTAKDEKIKNDSDAETKAKNAKEEARKTKERKIQDPREKIKVITEQFLEKQENSISKASITKSKKDDDAEKDRQKANDESKSVRDKKVLDIKTKKQNADEKALEQKNKSDDEAKAEIKEIKEYHNSQLKKLDEEMDEFRKNLKSNLDTYSTQLESIKAQEARNQELIAKTKEERKQAQHQMRNIVEKLMKCKNQIEIKLIVSASLLQATNALNKIEVNMINVGQFWNGVEHMCESIVGPNMKRQVEVLSEKQPHERIIVWQSTAFKQVALNFYGRWIALKEICSQANVNVNKALEEVQKYMVESPQEDEAFKSLQEMGGRFLEELKDQT